MKIPSPFELIFPPAFHELSCFLETCSDRRNFNSFPGTRAYSFENLGAEFSTLSQPVYVHSQKKCLIHERTCPKLKNGVFLFSHDCQFHRCLINRLLPSKIKWFFRIAIICNQFKLLIITWYIRCCASEVELHQTRYWQQPIY